MSKSIKFTDNTYLDSTGITHNRQLLSTKLNDYDNNKVIDSGDGYIKFNNGILINYGLCYFGSVPAGAGNGKTVNLTVPFKAGTTYCVSLSINNGGSYYSFIGMCTANKTSTNFTINLWNNDAYNIAYLNGIDYIAIGKWK